MKYILQLIEVKLSLNFETGIKYKKIAVIHNRQITNTDLLDSIYNNLLDNICVNNLFLITFLRN